MYKNVNGTQKNYDHKYIRGKKFFGLITTRLGLPENYEKRDIINSTYIIFFYNSPIHTSSCEFTMSHYHKFNEKEKINKF